MLTNLRHFDKSEVAQERMKIINFYQEHGGKATKEAFGADRKVISQWRKRLREGKGSLASLIPKSTRPRQVRRSTISAEIIDFIENLRKKRPRIGKEKIKPLLDKYCQKEGIETVSESTIGNIIRRRNFFFQKESRVYHNPNHKWAQKKAKKKRKLRTKHPIRPQHFGHIVADTVQRVNDGIKDYLYSAIDAKLKFALTIPYKRLTSRNMVDFYERFKSVYPWKIFSWQCDNGAENLGEFEKRLKPDGIIQIFSYPRCPKINTFIERYNRTVQEEFVDYHLDIIHNKKLFCQELADYLIFYNTERPHKSLDLKSPMEYLVEKGLMSQKSLTYTSP